MTACVHRWLLQPNHGPTSDGVCRLCGETRLFNNSSYVGASDKELLNKMMTRPHLELADPPRQIGNVDRGMTR